ncbi:MAG: hypothetical protein CL949_22655 [Erythrobacter sp.]|nr:hypothetical protein [Erythrobacter sp.]
MKAYAKAMMIIVSATSLASCGHRWVSPRSTNPLIEDRIGFRSTDDPGMSVLASRADRRTILIFGEGKVCAEPSPDVAEAIYQQTVAELAVKEGLNAAAGSVLQTAIQQLTRRSQGLDFYRSGVFALCLMHYNGHIKSEKNYLERYDELLDTAAKLTLAEIEKLPEIAQTITQVSTPAQPVGGRISAPAAEPKTAESEAEDANPADDQAAADQP